MDYLHIDIKKWKIIQKKYHLKGGAITRDLLTIVWALKNSPQGMRMSNSTLADICECKERSIINSKSELKKAGLVDKAGKKQNGIIPLKPSKRCRHLMHLGLASHAPDINNIVEEKKKKEVSFIDTLPSSETKEKNTVETLDEFYKSILKTKTKTKTI